MTPTDILTAARALLLSPVVPAREEWLRGWIGPSQPDQYPEAMATRDGAIVDDAWAGLPRGIWLDLRRPEVRDRLVRCGAPEWCRDSVAGMLAWVFGIVDAELWRPWREVYRHYVDPSVPIANDALVWAREDSVSRDGDIRASADDAHGCACSDLDSLGDGRILEEADGWYIPLPSGAVGWLPREA